jgi:YHS domain-containing protein
MEVDEAQARAAGKTAEHGGQTYFFCSDTCRGHFLESPDKYLTHAGQEQGAPHAHGESGR